MKVMPVADSFLLCLFVTMRRAQYQNPQFQIELLSESWRLLTIVDHLSRKDLCSTKLANYAVSRWPTDGWAVCHIIHETHQWQGPLWKNARRGFFHLGKHHTGKRCDCKKRPPIRICNKTKVFTPCLPCRVLQIFWSWNRKKCTGHGKPRR